MKLFGLFGITILFLGCSHKPAPLSPPAKGWVRWEVQRKDSATYTVEMPEGWNTKDQISTSITSSDNFYNDKGDELTASYSPSISKELWDFLLKPPLPDITKKNSGLRGKSVSRNGWQGLMYKKWSNSPVPMMGGKNLTIALTDKKGEKLPTCMSRRANFR